MGNCNFAVGPEYQSPAALNRAFTRAAPTPVRPIQFIIRDCLDKGTRLSQVLYYAADITQCILCEMRCDAASSLGHLCPRCDRRMLWQRSTPWQDVRMAVVVGLVLVRALHLRQSLVRLHFGDEPHLKLPRPDHRIL